METQSECQQNHILLGYLETDTAGKSFWQRSTTSDSCSHAIYLKSNLRHSTCSRISNKNHLILANLLFKPLSLYSTCPQEGQMDD